MHRVYPIAIAALVWPALVLAQPSGADSGGPGKGQKFAERFKKADANGGKLTRAEAESGGMKMVARNFDAIDTNKDGFVTPDEIRHAMQIRREGKAAAGGASGNTAGAAPK